MLSFASPSSELLPIAHHIVASSHILSGWCRWVIANHTHDLRWVGHCNTFVCCLLCACRSVGLFLLFDCIHSGYLLVRLVGESISERRNPFWRWRGSWDRECLAWCVEVWCWILPIELYLISVLWCFIPSLVACRHHFGWWFVVGILFLSIFFLLSPSVTQIYYLYL